MNGQPPFTYTNPKPPSAPFYGESDQGVPTNLISSVLSRAASEGLIPRGGGRVSIERQGKYNPVFGAVSIDEQRRYDEALKKYLATPRYREESTPIVANVSRAQARALQSDLGMRGFRGSRIASKLNRDEVMNQVEAKISNLDITEQEKEELLKEIKNRIANDTSFFGRIRTVTPVAGTEDVQSAAGATYRTERGPGTARGVTEVYSAASDSPIFTYETPYQRREYWGGSYYPGYRVPQITGEEKGVGLTREEYDAYLRYMNATGNK